MQDVTFWIAFLAGLASFLSPCVLALVPAYIGYLSGRSAGSGQGSDQSSSWTTLSHGFAFVSGFTVVFVVFGALIGAINNLLNWIVGGITALMVNLGWLAADAASEVFINGNTITSFLVKIGGIIVVLFGLHMLHIIRIPFLDYDTRVQYAGEDGDDGKQSYWSSAMMGIFFSAGWAPCTGPVLGAIFTMSLYGGSPLRGAFLLIAYSAGLAIPFLLAATQIGWVTTILRKYSKVMLYTERVMGVLLIGLGVLLFIGKFEAILAQSSSISFLPGYTTAIETTYGMILLVVVALGFLIGLIPGYWAKNKGKRFIDWWFIGTGAAVIFLGIIAYILLNMGVFDSFIAS